MRGLQPDLADQQRFWNRWNTLKRHPAHLNQWCRERGEMVLKILRSLALDTPRILDLGCGTGWLTGMLHDVGPATGIDIAESAIALARSQFPKITFLAGDLFEIPLPREHFDVVVSQEVIAHIEDQSAYIDRAASLLRPGGYLIITTPNKFVMERADFDPQPPEHLEHWLSMRRLKRLLRPCFRVLWKTSIVPMGHRGILRVVNSYKLNRALGILMSPQYLDALKERAGLGYTLIVLAQKKG